ncbi:MAG: D-tyrosyl-tRNA(Tyr) deacylase [Deltaproteobacteria bacterium]|nr:D-tyrosyl-tRNA(Tyr) deacylase [Deltaproteobacteria bacterium]
MRAVVQRVKRAQVEVGGLVKVAIDRGLLVFVGIEKGDGAADVEYIASKLVGLRIFEDGEGKMNLSVSESDGSLLIVSQFTLLGDGRKGRRPSFGAAEEPGRAKELYETLITSIRQEGLTVESGEFQAHMEVGLVNDGPVTILLDSRRLF